MDAEETIALFEKGMKAWNDWAEEMMRTEPKESPNPSTSATATKAQQEERRKWERRATAHFRDYTFEDRADFWSWKFPHNIYFTEVIFQDGLKFHKNDICGDVEIRNSRIDGSVDFSSLKFRNNLTITSNTLFSSDMNFIDAEIHGKLSISDCEFPGDCAFYRSNLRADFDFFRNSVSGEFSTEECDFSGTLHAGNSSFSGGSRFAGLDLTSASFVESNLTNSDLSNTKLIGANFEKSRA